jgi:hypothetical protein
MKEFNAVFVEGTVKTPQVDFNNLTGELVLKGKSIPENAAKLYEPLLNWTNSYIKAAQITTNLRLDIEYFNSASFVWISMIVRALSKIERKDAILYIHLYFDMEDFDDNITGQVRDLISVLVDKISDTKISIGIKTHGTDTEGKIIKESTILI